MFVGTAENFWAEDPSLSIKLRKERPFILVNRTLYMYAPPANKSRSPVHMRGSMLSGFCFQKEPYLLVSKDFSAV